jgi:formylmethanofuran dehydrogenase subunit E
MEMDMKKDMGGKMKCEGCGGMFDAKDMVKGPDGKMWCKACAEKMQKEMEHKM